MKDNRVRNLHPYLVGYPEFWGGSYIFVLKKLSVKGRILPKKIYVVPLSTTTFVWDWVRSTACFNEVNDALAFFGYDFQLDEIAVDYRGGKYFFYYV